MVANNNTANVSTGGGVRGHYIYSGPISAPIPTDYDSKLSDEYVNLGFVTSDGVVISDSEESETFTDLNGDTIATSNPTATHTVTFTLAENKKDSLAEQYGHKNVTDKEGMITVEGKSGGFEPRVYIVDTVYNNNRRGRIVFPNGLHQSTGDLTVVSTSLYAREVTILAMPDEAGASFYHYYQSTETKPSVVAEIPTSGEALGKDIASFGTFELNGTTITGTANKIKGFTQFSNDPNEQEGYFAPLKIDDPKGTKVVSSRKPERKAELDDDGIVIVFLGKENIIPGLKVDVYPAQGEKYTYTYDVTAGE